MKENNEMNLWDLITLFFQWIGKCIKWIICFCGKTFQLTYRKLIIVSLFTLIGLSVGVFLSRNSARYYKAGTMAILNGPTSQYVKQVSKQLEFNFPKKKSQPLSLGALLDLPDSITNQIKEIKSFYVIDFSNDSTPDVVDFHNNHSLEDTLNVISPMYIYFELKTKKVNELPIFENAFLHYFNTNNNLVELYTKHQEVQANTIKTYRTEIDRLDSLEKFTYFRPKDIPQIHSDKYALLIGEQRTQLFHYEKIKLLKQLQSLEQNNALCSAPVVLLDHFTPMPSAVNGRIKMCFLGLIIGYILGLICAALAENIKSIMAFLKQK